MARSLRIPAVVGLKTAGGLLNTGDFVLLDGFNGVIILHPTDQTLFEYGQLEKRQLSLAEKLRDTLAKPAVTLDNHRVFLSANIESAADAEAVKASGAEGVGLFRTEYLYINRDVPPSEEEQYQAYRQAAQALRPSPVVIRTLDLGGDKLLSSLASATDDLEFSNNGGSTWTHVPTADLNGYDTSGTTHIRMRPKGTMAGASAGGSPSFQLRFRVRVN